MAVEKQQERKAQMNALAFGSDQHITQLRQRLIRHFDPSDSPSPTRHDALVIGLFGEWGSGKSLWLHHLHADFEQRIAKANPERALTLPVFFNAWRFEAEDHLIVPLLKTTQHALQNVPLPNESRRRSSRGLWRIKRIKRGKWEWVKKRAKLTAQSALAVAAGLKLSFDLPGAKASFDLNKVMKDERERWERIEREDTTNDPDPFADLGDLASLYYDFQHTMQRITGRASAIDGGGDEPKLNLLFLIDDLDRCLPEKAVQMLEAIKLFLDVPGCAFVLALDDEVVERGIAHRYRDYLQNHDHQFDAVAHSLHPTRYKDFEGRRQSAPQAPITGAEYLEKIVQIPLRISPPRRDDIGRFLRDNYPQLFLVPETPEPDQQRPKSPNELETRGKITTGEHEPQRGESDRQQAELLALFQRAVPANPRKLIRSAELLSLQLRVASARGWQGIDRLTLARLVLLQLFAPEVYRFCQRQPYHTFLTQMEQWQSERLFIGRNRLEEAVNAELKDQHELLSQAGSDMSTADDRIKRLEDLMLPFIGRLRDCQCQRGTFDPVKLIDPKQPSDTGLRRYFDLFNDPTTVSSSITLMWDIEGPSERVEIAELSDPSLFVSLATSSDPLHWREATETEEAALADHHLPDEVFEQILPTIKDFEPDELLLWIEHFFDCLSPTQFEQIYHDSRLLAQINDLLKRDAEA